MILNLILFRIKLFLEILILHQNYYFVIDFMSIGIDRYLFKPIIFNLNNLIHLIVIQFYLLILKFYFKIQFLFILFLQPISPKLFEY